MSVKKKKRKKQNTNQKITTKVLVINLNSHNFYQFFPFINKITTKQQNKEQQQHRSKNKRNKTKTKKLLP